MKLYAAFVYFGDGNGGTEFYGIYSNPQTFIDQISEIYVNDFIITQNETINEIDEIYELNFRRSEKRMTYSFTAQIFRVNIDENIVIDV